LGGVYNTKTSVPFRRTSATAFVSTLNLVETLENTQQLVMAQIVTALMHWRQNLPSLLNICKIFKITE
jgi:hypothetical protein